MDMSEAAYVAVDWGTSSFRLWLIDRAGQVLGERRSGEGMIAAAKVGFALVLQRTYPSSSAAWPAPVRDGSKPAMSIRPRRLPPFWSVRSRFPGNRATF